MPESWVNSGFVIAIASGILGIFGTLVTQNFVSPEKQRYISGSCVIPAPIVESYNKSISEYDRAMHGIIKQLERRVDALVLLHSSVIDVLDATFRQESKTVTLPAELISRAIAADENYEASVAAIEAKAIELNSELNAKEQVRVGFGQQFQAICALQD